MGQEWSAPKAIRFPSKKEGNLMYPLPPDYTELSKEGQRLARINACKLQETPRDFVIAWDFFRRTYLFPTEKGFFYGADLVESPPFHYEIVWSVVANQFNIRVCPRGFGKSTLADEIILLLALTREYFPITLCLATATLVGERFEIYGDQLTRNEYILRDFGNMRPPRGHGKWNQDLLHLKNGSRIRGFGVDSKKRGTKPRPRFLVLDDPEYDAKGSTDREQLRIDFENLLMKVLMNMGETRMAMLWLGTMISKQSSLYFATAEGEHSDPRFGMWSRKTYTVYSENEEGEQEPLWEEYMDEKLIEEKKKLLGAANFATEYMNNPGEGTAETFEIDPERHFYEVSGDLEPHPLQSPAKILYKQPDTEGQLVPMEVSYAEKVNKMYRIMTVDYASTVSPTSDFSSIVVMGFEQPYDVLWVLDCWQGKVKDQQLIGEILKMGVKWKPRCVGVEAVSIQQRIYEMVDASVAYHAADRGWYPKVMPIKYTRAQGSKQDRIGGMQWRFTSNRVRLRSDVARSNPHWRTLIYQLEQFRQEANDGNLQHDDLVDAMAMYQEVARAKPREVPKEDRRVLSSVEMLKKKVIIDEQTGIQPIMGVSASEIPIDTVNDLIGLAYENETTDTGHNARSLDQRWHCK